MFASIRVLVGVAAVVALCAQDSRAQCVSTPAVDLTSVPFRFVCGSQYASRPVADVLVRPKPAGSTLYMVGEFRHEPTSIGAVASWNGEFWTPIAAGSSPVHGAFGAFIEEFQGEMIVGGKLFESIGGSFQLGLVEGDTLVPIPFAGHLGGGAVSDAAVFDGRLVIVGAFDVVPYPPYTAAKNIVAWDGSAWSPLGDGIEYQIARANCSNRLTRTRVLAQGDQLFVVSMDDVTANAGAARGPVLRWDGSAWSSITPASVGSENNIWNVTDAIVFNGALHISGNLPLTDDLGNFEPAYIRRWNGSEWVVAHEPWFLNEIDEPGAIDLAEFNGVLHAVGGGNFGLAAWKIENGVPIELFDPGFKVGGFLVQYDGVLLDMEQGSAALNGTRRNGSRWDGSRWCPLTDHVDDAVHALATWKGAPVLGGEFSVFKGLSDVSIVQLDGPGALSLLPINRTYFQNRINQMVEVGGVLIATGLLPLADAGGLQATIAQFDGVDWSPLPNLPDRAVGPIMAVGGQLVASFTLSSGSQSAVFVWDGANQWTQLGDASAARVIGLGSFQGLIVRSETAALGNPARIRQWNGTEWLTLGTLVGGSAGAIAEFENELYVGGTFSSVNGVNVSNIARWNGNFWKRVAGGTDQSVFALEPARNGLWVGGSFSRVNAFPAPGEPLSLPVNNLAVWDGLAWRRSEACFTPSPVRDIHAVGNEVYFAGEFTLPLACPGSESSSFVGRVRFSILLGDADRSGGVGFPDITAVLRNFGRTGPTGLDAIVGDADGNGVVDMKDLTVVLADFGAACP